jgi:hypothetical protein
MLYHMSMDAQQPKHVAEVLAEIFEGVALPFPPVSSDAWMAMAGDDRGTAIEVYPAGICLAEAPGDADAYGETGSVTARTATHAAIGTHLDEPTVLAIASREGWPAKYRKRGGLFGVIEMWIEGRQMIEILTPEMQAEYRATMTPDRWRALLAANRPQG